MQVELSDDELKRIVEAIMTSYGYDFSGYSAASLKRRMVRFAEMENVPISGLKQCIANDRECFSRMLESLTVNVTEMFRDPPFYKVIREEVLPVLAAYPLIKIWHAGCSTGEEAFSMAILLHEAGLLDRSRIYATDMSLSCLEQAGTGIIAAARIGEYRANYEASGGQADFSGYYSERNNNVLISGELRKNILFSQHNLVTDFVFNEFHMVCCRNVLIYFNRHLQRRVVDLFYNSLSPSGFLALGTKESLLFTDCASEFDIVDQKNKIFRKKRK